MTGKYAPEGLFWHNMGVTPSQRTGKIAMAILVTGLFQCFLSESSFEMILLAALDSIQKYELGSI